MLTKEQQKKRDGKLTASFLPPLMAGNLEAIQENYDLLTSSHATPRDLSKSWPVQFGSFVESFALDWHQEKTDPITRRGEVVDHPTLPWFCCTLDGFRELDRCIIEVKTIFAMRSLRDDVIPYYVPQLIGQRACTGAALTSLLIVHGGGEPQEFQVEIDPDYERQVWRRAAEFWACVETLTPPIPPIPPLPPPEKWRRVDLNIEASDHNWSGAMIAAIEKWRDTLQASVDNAQAKVDIKAILPDDVGKVFYQGVSISRAVNGGVYVKRGK